MIYKHRSFLTYNGRYYLTHPLELLADIFKEIKAFFQRGWRGYADSDLWSLDHYLIQVLAPGLREFARSPFGWPGEPMTYEGWKEILNEMADGFQAVADVEERFSDEDLDIKEFIKDEKEAWKKLDNSLKLLRKWFGHLWD